MKTGYPEEILKHCLSMRDRNRKSKAQVELKVIMEARRVLPSTSAAKKESGKIVTCCELIIFI